MIVTRISRGIAALVLTAPMLAPSVTRAQCEGQWTLHAATGDVADVATHGTVAWIAAQGGVIRIDLDTSAAARPDQVKFTDREGLVSGAVTAMAMDGFGNVYVGTRFDGISAFSAGGAHLRDLSSFNEFVWSDRVSAIAAVGDTTSTYTIVRNGVETQVTGDRIVVASADSYTPTGGLLGGGIKTFVVRRSGSGFEFFPEPGFGFRLEAVREILAESTTIWAGTTGQGVWRRTEGPSPVTEQVLSVLDGLASPNVKRVVRAPAPGAGADVLWLGTGSGLQWWDGGTLTPVTFFDGQNILDVKRRGTSMYVLAETPALARDLYRIDLTQPQGSVPARIPRATCFADTLYVPRAVAADDGGRIVLGTREDSFGVLGTGGWTCPPSLGPHSSLIADLAVAPDGTLYFGTGSKLNTLARTNGLGWFDGADWRSVTPADNAEMLEDDTTELVFWPDSTLWFGSTVDRDFGGLNRLFPATGVMEKYHDDVVDLSRRTLGRNVWSLELDAQSNLWVVYGQQQGGLSVIEYPSLRITNFPFVTIFGGTTTLLRHIAFDTRGRAWISTNSIASQPGQLYVVDTRGTIATLADDVYTAFNVANEISDIGPIEFLAIDSTDQIWLAGDTGLVVGQIGSDIGGRPTVSWTRVNPTSAQLGQRNPLPYRVGAFDWEDNLWLGTESSGLVRISKDRSTWTWFDQLQGCPLPDQSVTGVYVDRLARRVYVGTSSGGIAVVDLSASIGPRGGDLQASPFPNPWRPASGSVLSLAGIPTDETTSVRVYTLAGELVHEEVEVRGAKTWNGRNLGDQFVESGMYLVIAEGRDGKVYRGKVAVVR